MAVWKGMYDLVWMLVNSSLKEGVILLALKETVVYSLFKGLPLNPTRLDSFCPVSHILFLGKVVERVAARQPKTTLNEADDQVIWYDYHITSYQTPFSWGSGQGLGLRQHWVHSWMTPGRNRMEIVHPSWLLLTSTINHVIPFIWLWKYIRAETLCGFALSSGFRSSWCWWGGGRDAACSVYFVGCLRVWSSFLFYLTCTWGQWMKWSVDVKWDITNIWMTPNFVSQVQALWKMP